MLGMILSFRLPALPTRFETLGVLPCELLSGSHFGIWDVWGGVHECANK